MSFTITQPLGRLPAFAEIQKLAEQHGVKIQGDERSGDFCHPNAGQPKIAGHYTIGLNSGIRGDFSANVMGKLAGNFALMAGTVEVTITEKPFLLPEAVLKSTLSAALLEFCKKIENAGG
jgi:hypothetical protein